MNTRYYDLTKNINLTINNRINIDGISYFISKDNEKRNNFLKNFNIYPIVSFVPGADEYVIPGTQAFAFNEEDELVYESWGVEGENQHDLRVGSQLAPIIGIKVTQLVQLLLSFGISLPITIEETMPVVYNACTLDPSRLPDSIILSAIYGDLIKTYSNYQIYATAMYLEYISTTTTTTTTPL